MMKAIRYTAAIALLTVAITACSGNGSKAPTDSTKDTVAKAAKHENVFKKAPLDTIQVETLERNKADTLDSRPVH